MRCLEASNLFSHLGGNKLIKSVNQIAAYKFKNTLAIIMCNIHQTV